MDSSHVILLQFCIPNFLDNQPEIHGTAAATMTKRSTQSDEALPTEGGSQPESSAIRYVHLLWLDAISRFWTPISRFLLLVILNSPDFYLAKVDRSETGLSHPISPRPVPSRPIPENSNHPGKS